MYTSTDIYIYAERERERRGQLYTVNMYKQKKIKKTTKIREREKIYKHLCWNHPLRE
jgi:hypothetical protein